MSLPNAFVTLLTTPSYLPGALVLLHSLLTLHPAPRDFKIVCLVTPETVDAKTIGELRKAGFDLVIGVEPIGSGRAGQAGLNLMGRPDLNFALTKLHLFRLHPFFSTLIYLDADVLPLRPLSHLFSTTNPHVLSACPDTGWPDCFNSGVMVIRPRESDWKGLRQLLSDGEGDDGIYRESEVGNGSFDGADQGLLNEWFSEEGGGGEWHRLPFTYNVTPTAAYTWAPAYKRYGHKINNVHFIGSNKPWSNMAGRPAGVSNVQGKEATYDYPALLDRWYHVYDTHVRPTAAHAPDISRRFAVPETVAVWNQFGVTTGVPQQPDDRLNLDELKTAAARGVFSLKPGQYTSLPLEGRVDLLMPKPQPKPASIRLPASPPPDDPSALTTPPHSAAPLPQSNQQQTEQPPTWDASRYAPPTHGRPEMSIRMDTIYHNAWEQPANQQSTYYRATSHQAEPQYPTLPDNVKNDNWYSQFTGSKPDRSSVHAVFPWEAQGSKRPTPGRVFPRGDSPPPTQSQRPTILVREATPDLPSPQHHAAPSPPQHRSMAEAMASYTNAWDDVPQINRYVKRMSGMSGDGKSFTNHGGLQSVPGTPKGGGTIDFSRRKSDATFTDTSADGDDEGDESDDEDSSNSPVLTQRGGVFQEQQGSGSFGSYPQNESYRDRSAQTDKSNMADAKVQTPTGNPESPVVRTFPVPTARSGDHAGHGHHRRQSRVETSQSSSSTDTTPRHLMTPPSDSFASGNNASSSRTGPGGQLAYQPLPDYGFDFKGVPHAAHGQGQGKGKGSRVWDPSTDPETRKKDSQEVLSRFMRAGEFGSR